MTVLTHKTSTYSSSLCPWSIELRVVGHLAAHTDGQLLGLVSLKLQQLRKSEHFHEGDILRLTSHLQSY